MRRLPAAFLVASLLVVLSVVHAEDFFSTGDTNLDQFQPDTVRGLGPTMTTRNAYGGGGPRWEMAPLVQFDLSSLVGSSVTSATLHLYYYAWKDNDPTDRVLSSKRVTSSWDEATVTWSTRPTWAANATSTAEIPPAFGWMSWDVTADVQAIASGGAANHGWIIRDEVNWGSGGIPMIRFRTKEYEDLVPRLEVEATTVPCGQADYPACFGACPVGEFCKPDPGTESCACAPPCDLAQFPECFGSCPSDRICVFDSDNDQCLCEAEGSACAQCGPGDHFIDACGPGSDWITANGVLAGIDMDLDCEREFSVVLGPCPAPDHLLRVDKLLGPIDDSENFPGTSPVNEHPTGPGLDVIDTEIVSMCLTDGLVTLAAGAAGPSVAALMPSLGAIAEDESTPDPSMADSFFDVFFEVSGVLGSPVYNRDPLRIEGRIDCLPPAARYSHPERICIPLYEESVCVGGPNHGSPCVYDLDCPDGSCPEPLPVANLVSASHSVNAPVCDESPFPECLGGCPWGEVCVPDPQGDSCVCQQRACEGGPYPECLGECTGGAVCVGDPDTGACICDAAPCNLSYPTCEGDCPAGTFCEPGPNGCVCGPIGCSQSGFPECVGECPSGLDCAAGPGFCQCQPSPCDQGSYPTCQGGCPPDQQCVGDPATGDCVCASPGQACTECGPGEHFLDACGPGTDLIEANGLLAGIDMDLDCQREFNLVFHPCPPPEDILRVDRYDGPLDDSLSFPGTSPTDGHPSGPGLDVIDTEIKFLCLTASGSVIMAAGAEGPASLSLLPSLGAVAEDLTTPDSTMADSFFDVFFEVSGGPFDVPLYNQVALRVESRVNCLPPRTGYSHPESICLPLYTEGSCTGGSNDGNRCASDLNCPGGTCDGQDVFANLVAASHSVNEPVCDDSPFPACDGDCPNGEICVEDPAGAECVCERVGCEQSDFAQCAGQCLLDQVCLPDTVNGVCECSSEPVSCDQSVYPTCGGLCPPGERCTDESGLCVCEPIPPPCAQSGFPVCDGECPPEEQCASDGLSHCFCEPLPPACATTEFPECGGRCPGNGICVSNGPVVGECWCNDQPEDLLSQPPLMCKTFPLSECYGPSGHCRYLISLPAIDTIDGARDLCRSIPGAVSVEKWLPETDSFLEYECPPNASCNASGRNAPPCDDPCFCIRPGEGVFVTVDGPTSIQIRGSDAPMTLPLYGPQSPLATSGTQTIALPYRATVATARDLFTEINAQGGQVENVAKYITETGLFESYTFAGYDFPLKPGEGYMVKVGQDSLYTPSYSPGPAISYCDGQGARFYVQGVAETSSFSWAIEDEFGTPVCSNENAQTVPGHDAAQLAEDFVNGINGGACAGVQANLVTSFPTAFDIILGDLHLGRPRLIVGAGGAPPPCEVDETGCNFNPTVTLYKLPPAVPGGGPSGLPVVIAKLDEDASELRIEWDANTCFMADDYNIIYGFGSTLPTEPGGTYSLAGEVCNLGRLSPVIWTDVPDPSGDSTFMLWFLVVATDDSGTEGSWGTESGGAERQGPGPDGSSGTCGVTNKDPTNTCGQ